MIDSHCILIVLAMLGQSANSNYMTSSGMKRGEQSAKWIPTVTRLGCLAFVETVLVFCGTQYGKPL